MRFLMVTLFLLTGPEFSCGLSPAAATEPLRLRVISYNIHHGEGVDRRLDLPRIANLNGPTELEDRGEVAPLAERLRGLGHQVQVRRHEGGLTAIRRSGDGWQGGADPRRDGVARGD